MRATVRRAGLFCFFVGVGFSQSRPGQQRISQSVAWRGTLKVVRTVSGDRITTPGPTGGTQTFSANTVLDLRLNLDKFDGRSWTGTATGTYSVDKTTTIDANGCNSQVRGNGSFPVSSPFELILDASTDTFTFAALDTPSVSVNVTTTVKCPGVNQTNTGLAVDYWFGRKGSLPIAGTGASLRGSVTFRDSFELGGRVEDDVYTWDLNGEIIELVVDPQGYDTWRPEGGTDEATIGNSISVMARLQSTDGSAVSSAVRVDQITFELQDTSHEPGIAMNYPPAGRARKTADLQFDTRENANLTVDGDERQQARTKSPNLTQATAVLSSYDWGGWTWLRVTARLSDGRQLVGHLKGNANLMRIPFPKRKDDSFIADAWKSSTGATGADEDDDEAEPVGDDRYKGDGLTLYEEYRGFIEKGAHIAGNPKRKDFFIQNRIGGDAQIGIWIFTDASGLEVHHDLQMEEMADDRLINFNKDKGPHAVDQHGAILKTDPSINGGIAYDSQGHDPGPPKNTEVVLVQPRDKEWTRFTDGPRNTSSNLSTLDRTIAYDRLIAHELMHTVGVWHHGDIDNPPIPIRNWAVVNSPFGDPNLGGSYTGPPVVVDTPTARLSGIQPVATVLREPTGEDVALYIARKMNDNSSGIAQTMLDLQPWQRFYSLGPLILGEKRGTHSGNQDCMMRYFFADIYRGEGLANTYYMLDSSLGGPADEPVGIELCDLATGTGVNDTDHRPQSRYGDAGPNRGACRKQIVVNDAANPPRR